MKKSILTLVLIVLTTMCFSQKPIRKITYYLDTLKLMSWDKDLTYDLAKKSNSITYDKDLTESDCYGVVDVDNYKLSYYNRFTNEFWKSYDITRFDFSTKNNYFFECYVPGCKFPQKILIAETVSKTYCIIVQFSVHDSTKIAGGYYDRNVELKIE